MPVQMTQVAIPFDWSQIATGTHYSPEAFAFLQEGLGYTSEFFTGAQNPYELDEFARHITGQQLCMGLRDFAIEQFGILAPVVLKHWGVHRTEDFGSMVFHMVDIGLLRTSPQDSKEDFRGVFNFDEAFHQNELACTIGSNL